jgi:hypothetical protein
VVEEVLYARRDSINAGLLIGQSQLPHQSECRCRCGARVSQSRNSEKRWRKCASFEYRIVGVDGFEKEHFISKSPQNIRGFDCGDSCSLFAQVRSLDVLDTVPS